MVPEVLPSELGTVSPSVQSVSPSGTKVPQERSEKKGARDQDAGEPPSVVAVGREEVFHQVRAIRRQAQGYRRGLEESGGEHYGSCRSQAGAQ